MLVKPRTSLNRMVMRRSAAQHQLLRRAGELFDHVRRQVIAERGTDLLALLLLAEIIDEGEHQIDQPARYQRISKVEELAARDEEKPRCANEAGDQHGAEPDNHGRRQ